MAKIKAKKTQSQSSKKKKMSQKQKQKQNININIDLSKKGGTSSRKASTSKQPEMYIPQTPMINTFQTPFLDNYNNMVTKDDMAKQIQSALVEQDKARRTFAADQNRNEMRELMLYQQGLYPGAVMFPMTATQPNPSVRVNQPQRPIQPIPLVQPSSRLVVPPPPPPPPPIQGERLGGTSTRSRLIPSTPESKPSPATPPIVESKAAKPIQPPVMIPTIRPTSMAGTTIPSQAEPKSSLYEKFKATFGLKPQPPPPPKETKPRVTPEQMKKYYEGTFNQSNPMYKAIYDQSLEKLLSKQNIPETMKKEFEMKKNPIERAEEKQPPQPKKISIEIKPIQEKKTPDYLSAKMIQPIEPPKEMKSTQLKPTLIPTSAPTIKKEEQVPKLSFAQQIGLKPSVPITTSKLFSFINPKKEETQPLIKKEESRPQSTKSQSTQGTTWSPITSPQGLLSTRTIAQGEQQFPSPTGLVSQFKSSLSSMFSSPSLSSQSKSPEGRYARVELLQPYVTPEKTTSFGPGVSGKGIIKRSPQGEFILEEKAAEKLPLLASSPRIETSFPTSKEELDKMKRDEYNRRRREYYAANREAEAAKRRERDNKRKEKRKEYEMTKKKENK